VLAQTRQDFELFIICDGAPEATAEAARAFAAQDRRIRAFIHPKGERHGEAWRHLALQDARGRIVCQIGDDDLWFPNHLAEVETLLATADFGDTLPMYLQPDGGARLFLADFGDATVRQQMTEGMINAFGPTPSAYRLETYRALPVGWSPAPVGMWTDLFMWRKFLALPDIRCATRFVATTLTFPQGLRQDWSLERRRGEIAAIASRIGDIAFRDRIFQGALTAAARLRVTNLTQLREAAALSNSLLDALDDAEATLEQIVQAGATGSQADLAVEAIRRLPDRAWRDQVRTGGASPKST
jgi:glycosyltransferase involved in cell wall biosynthesis